MLNLYTISPIIFFLVFAYLFNKNKLEESNSYIMLISIFEAVLGYLIVYFIFFAGFFSALYQYVLVIFLIAIVAYILFFIERDLDTDIDLQSESVKNILILFFITIGPFYLSLTVFRFHDILSQILYSSLVVIVIVCLYILLRKFVDPLLEVLKDTIFDTTERALAIIGGGIIFLIICALIFNIPTSNIKQKLNLTDHKPYVTFTDFPVILENNFDHQTDFQFTLELEEDTRFVDYFVYQDYLYLLSENRDLYTIDINSGEMIHTEFLREVAGSELANDETVRQFFFVQDDTLYLLAKYGLYQLSPENYTTLDTTDLINVGLIKYNNEIKFLRQVDTAIYQIYTVDNNQLSLEETINLTEPGGYDELVIIGETLFYQNDTTLTEYYQSQHSFLRINSSMIYDDVNHIMYATVYDDIERETVYYQSINGTDYEELRLSKKHNMIGFSHEGNTYYLRASERGFGVIEGPFERIEIMDEDFTFQAVHYFLDYEKFWIGHDYTKTSIVNYVTIDERLTYLQIDQNTQESLVSFHIIEEEETGLNAPFYAHHSLWMIFLTIIALFIPITNYREHITVIGFQEVFRRKNVKQIHPNKQL